ncbi:MAG: carbamoyl phosphate synthase small subunit [Oscillospiraceae bacterium]|jgi:carbamoyl-phosphate synthase small subunit|nr:carbamoyl phosphate synthase small subunit [Oscillospiraceae bacterium]
MTAYLLLENGRVFEGEAFGCRGRALGEVVFTTGMTGYLETLTDKSYYGQIIVQTFPLIGNYGVIPSDFETGPSHGRLVHAKAYIVKHWCREPSNFRSEGDLDTFLKSQNIIGLHGIDTRALTKIIRESGVMNGAVTDDPSSVDREALRAYRVRDAVAGVSTGAVLHFPGEAGRYKVALVDYGLKENIRRELVRRGCDVWVFPHSASARDILAVDPDGIMLSNGPGDPADNPAEIETLRTLLQTGRPIFGICLGHQLLALASGFRTEKLKFGHRGANQPVKDLTTGLVYITSQNHGYAVVRDSIDPAVARELFVNVNDDTCEGLAYVNAPVFSAQFHPEACGGPLDTGFLFDRFLRLMEPA